MRSVFALLLIPVMAAVPERGGDHGPNFGDVDRAALEALRGHHQRARALVGPASGVQADPAALVVLASVALDEGDLRDAGRYAARLRSIRPDAAEGKLLEALVKERVARPRADWLASGLAAVSKVQPLPAAEPLVDVWNRILEEQVGGKALPFPEQAAKKLNASDAFLARWAWPRPPGEGPDVALVVEAIPLASADERPLVLMAALDVLESSAPSARATDAIAARLIVIGKLRGTPEGRLRFIGLTKRPETEPIAEDEVSAIEEAVAGDVSPSFAREYGELLRVLEEVDPATAGEWAMSRAVDLVVLPPFLSTLGVRAERGGMSERARNRLEAALVRLAEVELQEGLFLTDMLGAKWLWDASQLRKDGSLKARAEAVRAEYLLLRDAHRCLHPLLRLPIRGLQHAWAAQIPNERLLAQHISRMGLSCPEPR